ncbi:DUF1214 domain-containing protein [Bdellovibrio svalbardensis]|uniref:DUF1214 domain-containing protein n=1 Tax=Bdellovibrio svalbardensis TaxID=2972972 RepID=A0ABT6DMK0_9BACT|nr:DUF1214 domain-containing protein [Bdellovibrio svalbardensis]MDG0818100.1 DUF1214 domain-containing protein [Bdellovibrio svalbardensis]
MRNILILIFAGLLSCQSSEKKILTNGKAEPGTNTSLARAGLSEKEVIDSYIYLMARYFVIRQERLDTAEKNLGYNKIKYTPLGKTDSSNPNLDVAYLEAWVAVDDKTCQVLEVPKITNRYYTVQVMDEWAGVITNINERNYPQHPNGAFAFCLKNGPETPKGSLRVDLPSYKAKILARIERKGSDGEAVRLLKAFKLVRNDETEIEPPQKIPMFTNEDLIRGEAFEYPMVETVLRSAPDGMKLKDDLQNRVRAVAKYAAQSDANKKQIEDLIQEKALPQLNRYLGSMGERKNSWITTAPYRDGFGEDYWFRTATTYVGIWWNQSKEVVVFISKKDMNDRELLGDNTYLMHFEKDQLPAKEVNAFWSLTVNPVTRSNISNLSKLTYGRDGSLTLAIGAKPRSNIPLTNWIPAAPGKTFSMILRMYSPKDSVLSSQWTAPPVIQIEGLDLQKTSQR